MYLRRAPKKPTLNNHFVFKYKDKYEKAYLSYEIYSAILKPNYDLNQTLRDLIVRMVKESPISYTSKQQFKITFASERQSDWEIFDFNEGNIQTEIKKQRIRKFYPLESVSRQMFNLFERSHKETVVIQSFMGIGKTQASLLYKFLADNIIDFVLLAELNKQSRVHNAYRQFKATIIVDASKFHSENQITKQFIDQMTTIQKKVLQKKIFQKYQGKNLQNIQLNLLAKILQDLNISTKIIFDNVNSIVEKIKNTGYHRFSDNQKHQQSFDEIVEFRTQMLQNQKSIDQKQDKMAQIKIQKRKQDKINEIINFQMMIEDLHRFSWSYVLLSSTMIEKDSLYQIRFDFGKDRFPHYHYIDYFHNLEQKLCCKEIIRYLIFQLENNGIIQFVLCYETQQKNMKHRQQKEEFEQISIDTDSIKSNDFKVESASIPINQHKLIKQKKLLTRKQKIKLLKPKSYLSYTKMRNIITSYVQDIFQQRKLPLIATPLIISQFIENLMQKTTLVISQNNIKTIEIQSKIYEMVLAIQQSIKKLLLQNLQNFRIRDKNPQKIIVKTIFLVNIIEMIKKIDKDKIRSSISLNINEFKYQLSEEQRLLGKRKQQKKRDKVKKKKLQ